jgi:hypothetical protein
MPLINIGKGGMKRVLSRLVSELHLHSDERMECKKRPREKRREEKRREEKRREENENEKRENEADRKYR